MELNQFYTTMNGSSSNVYNPEIGAPYAVNYKSQWYRGRIVNNSNGTLEVFFVDNGQTHDVDWNCLRHLDDKFLAVKEGVAMFKLSDIQPSGGDQFSTECVKEFKKMCRKSINVVIIEYIGPQQYEVTARTTGHQDIQMHSYLVQRGYAISTGSESNKPDVSERIARSPSTSHTKEKSDDVESECGNEVIERARVKIRHCVSPSEFYVILEKNLSHFNHLQGNIQLAMEHKEAGAIRDRSWSIRDKCFVFTAINNVESQWYRGIIVSIDINMYTVFLRDYGMMVSVKKSDLAEGHQILNETECSLIKCYLAYLQPADGVKWSLAGNEKFIESTQQSNTYAISIPQSQPNAVSVAVFLWSMKERNVSALTAVSYDWYNINAYLVYQGVVYSSENIQISQNRSVAIEAELIIDRTGRMTDEIISDLKNICRDDSSLLVGLSTEITQCSKWIPAKRISKHLFKGVPTFIDNNFIIHLYDEEQKQLLDTMSKHIHKEFPIRNTSRSSSWTVGETCLAKYCDNYFYRAVVQSVNANEKECQVCMLMLFLNGYNNSRMLIKILGTFC